MWMLGAGRLSPSPLAYRDHDLKTYTPEVNSKRQVKRDINGIGTDAAPAASSCIRARLQVPRTISTYANTTVLSD
jgi:hypothetical protein